MRQRLARFLFVTLTATAACKGSSPAPETATPVVSLSNEEAPPPTTTTTSHEPGRADGQYKIKTEPAKTGEKDAKQEAIANAQVAGVLGASSGADMATAFDSGTLIGT